MKQFISLLTNRERIAFIVGAVILALSAIGIFTLRAGGVAREVPATGGHYREGVIGQPAFVNPVIASSEVDKSLVRLLFSNIQDIATTIESGEDARTWKIRLKENLIWHDGEKLTSDDVIFTIQKIQDPDSRSPLFKSWQGILAQRVSEREILLNLGVTYAFFEDNLSNLYVLPKHLFEAIPVANWRISEFNLKPIGSGPYRFEKFETESDGFISSYRLAANDLYETSPYISSFTLRFFREKQGLTDAYNAGKIDGFAGVDYKDIAELKRPHTAFRFQLPNYYAVFFNQGQNIALKELEVRRALKAAIDTDALIADLFDEQALPVHGPIPPSVAELPIPSEETLPPNVILEDAGWELEEDGYRSKKIREDTIPLEIRITTPTIPFLEATANAIAKNWEAIGVRTTVDAQPLNEILEGPIKNRDYQALLFGHVLTPHADLFSFWHSSQKFYPGLNISLYDNEGVDELIEHVRQNPDKTNRLEELGELHAIIAEEAPALFLYSPAYFYILRRDIRGIEEGLIADPADRFRGISSWYTKTKLVFN